MAEQPLLREQVKFWRDPDLRGVDILRARYVTHAFSSHSHDGYAIGIIEAGIEEFTYRGTTHQAHAGELVIIHPGEVHTGQAGEPQGWTYRMLYPDVALMLQASENLGLRTSVEPYFPAPVIADPALVSQFHRLHLALEAAESQLERQSHFLWVMARLIERYGEIRSVDPNLHLKIGPDAEQRVRRVQQYIAEHYSRNVSLEQLSQVAGVKPLKLLRQFQKLTGLPPHRYLVQVRVRQAQHLLALGIAIADVATATGFADQSHLNRHFKRLMGVTPGQYALGCR